MFSNSIDLGFSKTIPLTYMEIVKEDACLDKKVSPWDCELPHIWSLLDMLNFYANEFIEIMSTIMLWAADEVDSSHLSEILKDVNKIHKELESIEFNNSLLTSNRIIHLINNSPDKLNMIHQQLNELINRIYDEFNNHHLLILLPSEKEYFGTKDDLFGKEVAIKFSDLTEDISESSNCYALNRYTACVFHLMRIMKKAVQELANKLNIPSILIDEDWQRILNSIRGQLNALYPKHKDPERVKYEAIIGHLETIKIAWRNPTMHPKATYTREQAKTLLDGVGIFLKDLIKVL